MSTEGELARRIRSRCRGTLWERAGNTRHTRRKWFVDDAVELQRAPSDPSATGAGRRCWIQWPKAFGAERYLEVNGSSSVSNWIVSPNRYGGIAGSFVATFRLDATSTKTLWTRERERCWPWPLQAPQSSFLEALLAVDLVGRIEFVGALSGHNGER